MAVTAHWGWETQQVPLEATSLALNGTASLNTNASFVRTGAASLRCNPASGASGYVSGTATFPLSRWVHFGLYVATLPSLARVIWGFAPTAGSVNLRLNASGTLEVRVATTSIGTSSTALTPGQYYWIGVRNSTGTTVPYLQINGTDEVTGTATVTAGGLDIGVHGTEASAIDIYIDDIIQDDAGFLQPSKVAWLRPVSDNARVGFTTGAGGTTNLFDAVDNTPPTGVASASETATTNIRSSTSAGVESYTANLTTYTNAGIGAADTVLAVNTIVQHGEDIATQTKTGSWEMLSNPVIATAAFTYGADGGAHGATPTLWSPSRGAYATSPSLTLGTSPTMKVIRDTTTRAACVDLMGAYVSWTPAVASDPPPVRNKPIGQMLAH